ncbi:ABC-type Fe3+/spermidine/putrescine transport system ATPase subunit [Constrictibacter sp. MBR-5]|jgi:ABC-type Fe3+/spermidine/putrescine transport system ATPase subunit|uniref:ABC transporter ATP-binding protein n=1 Tax=Constrictibacter sp. MBR-5 TaxID=3156467 RepID=UPI003394E90F
MPRLVLKQIVKTFGAFTAVDHLDLDLADGEFVSLLGPSGCGKTTTLRMIAGFMPPTEGTIEIDGKILSSPSSVMPPERRGMSMIFQSYAIWPNMTVFENVAFGLKLRKLSGDEIRDRVGRILDVVQMGHLAGRYPSELSGGQQQRVALARAIVVQPAVLLLDEPLSNLDASLREEMRFEIRRLHDEFRITTVYVTHDQGEAMVTSDRIAVMNAGRIEQIDDPFSLYNRPRTRFVAGFIGRTNFIEARREANSVTFDGFAVPAGRFNGELDGRTGAVTFSVRPQNISLHGSQPSGTNGLALPGRIVERAYLGEFWDYVVAPADSGLRLRVVAPPREVFEAGQTVWIGLAPDQMTPLA